MSRRPRQPPPAAPRRGPRGIPLVVLAALVALVAGVLLKVGLRRPKAAGASVLLVTIDTLRADHVGAYGDKEARTPALDALAARGLLFEEAVTSVPLTLPSHSTILSGLEPPHHGVRGNGTYSFPAERETLATALHARGYATGAFVAAYVLDRRFGLARGFDTYDDRIERRKEGGVLESERPCGEVVAAASAWISRQTAPFLAWAHFYEPHAPYDPLPPYRDQHTGRPYDGEVSAADACLERLGAVAEAARPGRLVVAVLGDHGEGLGEHGERTHGLFVYQSTLHVPLVLAGPGVPEGKRRGLARTVDVTPTLLGLLGVAALPGLDGVDLLAATPGEAYAEALYPESFGWAPLRALRSGSLKLIQAPRPEMYDLDSDPRESTNVLASRGADVARLEARLARLREGEAREARKLDGEAAERLGALGYVAGPASPASPRDPKDAVELWRLFEDASAAEAAGERGTALLDLAELVRRDPGNVAFRRSQASALRRAAHRDQALVALEELVRLAPSDALAWHERAVALAEAGRAQEALAAAERSTSLDPQAPEAWNHLGVLRAGAGHDEEALAAFSRACELDPTSARAWANRGNALRALGRPAEAREAYERAATLAPRDPDPLNGMGVLAVQAGDLGTAATLFGRALELDPSLGESRMNLAVVEARRGDTAAARKRLRDLIADSTDSVLKDRAREFLKQLPP
jgi:arylsulfatase A-like enzyme/Flp pilus assembly protein TadD